MRILLQMLPFLLLSSLSVSAQSVLLVDKRLQDPITFKPFFDDFPEQDLELHYRRFHPSLVPGDVDDFDVIMIAGGTHPDPAATHLIPEEAALLTLFVRDGGTAVFLFADQSTDNYIFNTILDSLDVGVRIEGHRIEDPLGPKATINPATHYLNLPRVLVSPDTPLGTDIEGFIAGGRMPSVLVGQTQGIEIPAYTARSSMRRVNVENTTQRGREAHYAAQARSYAAVVTARAGAGHVIMVPRFLINLNGYTGHGNLTPIVPPYWLEQNRRFESNLANYIGSIARGDYTPSDLMPLSHIDNIDDPTGLPEPDFKFRNRSLDEEVHDQDYDDLAPFTSVPPPHASFLNGQKVRSAHVSPPSADQAPAACQTFKEMGLNLLYVWGLRMDRDPSGNLTRINDRSEAFLDACGKAGLRVLIWGYLPDTSLWLNNQLPTTLVDGTGVNYRPPSPLDPDAWRHSLTNKAREYAMMARLFPDTIVGTVWDVELYGHPGLRITESHGFDNLCFSTFVRTEESRLRKANLYDMAHQIDQARRFRWLETNGLLRSYYCALEEGVYELMMQTREEIEQVHEGLEWALYAPNIPQSWFYRGVIRGFANQQNGELVHITWAARGAQQVSYWKATHGIDLIHSPAALMIVPEGDEWGTYLRMCLENEAGYWLYDASALIRPPEMVWQRRMELQQPPETVIDLISRANKK